jgi:xanthine/uracil permease
VTLIQSLGMTRWFGIKLPVMMGVTFAAVGPMVAMANAQPGVEGARVIFGAIIGAGMISMLIAPIMVSRCCASFRRWSPAPSSPSSASA